MYVLYYWIPNPVDVRILCGGIEQNQKLIQKMERL